jgi:hypothetical protein
LTANDSTAGAAASHTGLTDRRFSVCSPAPRPTAPGVNVKLPSPIGGQTNLRRSRRLANRRRPLPFQYEPLRLMAAFAYAVPSQHGGATPAIIAGNRRNTGVLTDAASGSQLPASDSSAAMNAPPCRQIIDVIPLKIFFAVNLPASESLEREIARVSTPLAYNPRGRPIRDQPT